MSAVTAGWPTKVLVFSVVVEIGTGFALMFVPALVVAMLLGAKDDATAEVVGRCFGIALLALGVACWPDRASSAAAPAGFRAMLIYNVLVALYLGYLGAVRHLEGLLLWPGVALHALVGLLLVAVWRGRHGMKANDS